MPRLGFALSLRDDQKLAAIDSPWNFFDDAADALTKAPATTEPECPTKTIPSTTNRRSARG